MPLNNRINQKKNEINPEYVLCNIIRKEKIEKQENVFWKKKRCVIKSNCFDFFIKNLKMNKN